jgi:DNA-binding transcriptional LysR family regulator
MIPDYLDTRQLEAFVAVVSIGSMTGAAKALGKSQSVMTRLIQDLEKELGFPVLHRNGPRIIPTEQGLAFFAQAELFLSGLRTISEGARKIAVDAARPIEVASVPALAASILPSALALLESASLPSHIHVKSTASENVVQAVLARTSDIGIASLPLDNSGLDVHWIGESPCVAVVSNDDELAKHSVVTPEDLQGRRLIVSANPYRLRMRINQTLEKHGVQPGGIIDSNATYVSLAMARSGLGIAVVESATIFGLPVTDVTAIPLSFSIPFHWGVITASGRPMGQTITALIEAIETSSKALPGFVKHSDKLLLQ